MYILTRILSRPNADIPYSYEVIKFDDEYRAYMDKNHAGLILENKVDHSEDKLSVTIRTVFSSRKALLKYLCDMHCYNTSIMPNAAYNIDNGIVTISTTSETKE